MELASEMLQTPNAERGFARLLDVAIHLTGAEFGFIAKFGDGEASARPYTDIWWDDGVQRRVTSAGPAGRTSDALDTLLGEAAKTGLPVLVSAPDDERRNGNPDGHTEIVDFLGVPFPGAGEQRGVLGLANAPGGFSEDDVERLSLTVLVAASILAAGSKKGRSQCDHRSLEDHERLALVTSSLASSAFPQRGERENPHIDEALAQLGELCNADRAYVFEFDDDDRKTMTNTFEWCAPGAEPMQENLQRIPADPFRWTLELLEIGELIRSTVDELPPEASAERETLEAQQIRSVLWIPLIHGDGLIGFAGFDDVHGRSGWGHFAGTALEQFGAVLALAIDRARTLSNERRWRWFIERAEFGLGITDSSLSRAFIANDAIEELTGIPLDDFRRDPAMLLNCVHPDHCPGIVQAMGHFVERASDPDEIELTEDFEFQTTTADPVRWLRLRLFAMDNEAERQIGLLVDDVTDVRELQTQLRRAIDRVTAARQSTRDVLAHVSHELRTPLQSALSFIELAQMDLEPGHATRHLALAEKATFQINDFVEDLGELSTYESGQLQLFEEAVDLASLAGEVIETNDLDNLRNDVQVSVEAPSSPAVVWTDRRRLGQVLTNLITNGVKYNRPNGSVLIRIAASHEEAIVEVIDTGVGLTDEEMQRLFVPFERLHARRHHIPGSGIGLVIARQLTEALDARLEVTSTPGTGSTFRLRIPIAARAGERSGLFQVLCIDDDASSRTIYETALGRVPSVQVSTASTLDQGIKTAAIAKPDLIILDRRLPDGDGVDAIPSLMALGDQGRSVDIAVLTSDTHPETRERALRAGAFAVLTKPVRLTQLIEIVNERAS